jgi:hypothetical protein
MSYDRLPLPFPLGTTHDDFRGKSNPTWPDDFTQVSLEGREYTMPCPDFDRTASPLPMLSSSARHVTVRIVRNRSGMALARRRLVNLLTPEGRHAAGHTTHTASRFAYPVDPWLPAGATVPANHLFYVVIEGPALVLRSTVNFASNVAVGDAMLASSADTSGAPEAGRLVQFIGAQGGANPTATNIDNAIAHSNAIIGFALSSQLTNQTNVDLLIHVRRRH